MELIIEESSEVVKPTKRVQFDENGNKVVAIPSNQQQRRIDQQALYVQQQNARKILKEIDQGIQMTYDDILAKMGVRLPVRDGSRPTASELGSRPTAPNLPPPQAPQPAVQNSYIYNKYFNKAENNTPVIRRPTTLNEYAKMLVDDLKQQRKNKQIKPKKLVYF